MKPLIATLALTACVTLCTCKYSTEPGGGARGTVTYRVSGECSSDVRISGKNETTRRFSSVPREWHYSFDANDGDFLSVSAQIGCTGDIRVSIEKDGSLYKYGHGHGQFVIVTASGSF